MICSRPAGKRNRINQKGNSRDMFATHQNRSIRQAAFNTLVLIFHQTVYNLRKSDRSPIWGLVTVMMQSMVMIAFFMVMFYIMGVRRSPVRGDFMIYIITGIFLFMTHVSAVGAVSGSGSINSAMTKHDPISSVVLLVSAALAALYKQVLSMIILLTLYTTLVTGVSVENWRGCLGMLLLAWFWGCCVGLVFLSIRPWWPKGAAVITMMYQRLNMIASGKMFLANTIPAFMLPYLSWNPLFHIIDQSRGYAFINYNPRNTNLDYPLICCVVVLMVGLMLEFVTRNSVSISWSAGK